MVPNLTHDWSVVFHPVSEDNGMLGSVLMTLSCYVVNPYVSVPHIVSIFQPFHPILNIYRPRHLPLSPITTLPDTTIYWSPALPVASLPPDTAPIPDT